MSTPGADVCASAANASSQISTTRNAQRGKWESGDNEIQYFVENELRKGTTGHTATFTTLVRLN